MASLAATFFFTSPRPSTALSFKCSLRRPFSNFPPDLSLPPPTTANGYGLYRRTPSSLGSKRFLPCLYSPAAIGGGAGIVQDAAAAAIVMGGAYALVLVFDTLTQRDLIQQEQIVEACLWGDIFYVIRSLLATVWKSLSRKLVHILSGLLFMACWPIFSTSTGARYFASLIPLANCLRLLTHGLSLATDEGLVKSVTREGNPEELLRGPLYYVLVLIFCVLVFWRESPVGVVSLAMMCGGDGIADIIGRRFGSIKLPYNRSKSWAGSISMFMLGFLTSIGMLYYFSALGYFELDWLWTVERVAVVALVATIVESLPVTAVLDDNISVPLASMITASLCFAQ